MQAKKSTLDKKANTPQKNVNKMVIKRKAVVSKEPVIQSRFSESLNKEKEAQLYRIVKSLMEPGKGILAVDDSASRISSCLQSLKLSVTDNNRARYFDVLLKAGKETCQFLSGMLVTEEASKLRFNKYRSMAFLLQEVDVHLGVRADKAFVKLPGTFGEWVTLGLDTLTEDCTRFLDKGASFVLWRSVYKITWCTPSTLALTVNSETMARFASICQATGLVPVVSAEILPDGDYDLTRCQGALMDIMTALLEALRCHHVYLEGLIIRLTPAFPGNAYQGTYDLQNVVRATLEACNRSIPTAVGGIMLARRESLAESIQVLNELNKYPMKKPQQISFCYSRVLHDDVIKIWAGQDVNSEKAKNALVERTKARIEIIVCPYRKNNISTTNTYTT